MKSFDGDMDDYRRRARNRQGRGITRSGAKCVGARPLRCEARRAAAGKRAETAPLRKRIAQAEVLIAQLTRQLHKLDTTLADGALFASDPAHATELSKTRAQVVAAIAKAEEEWLAASTALETT